MIEYVLKHIFFAKTRFLPLKKFEQKIGKEKFLTFGDNYLLVELSFMEAPKTLLDIIFKFKGVVVL